MKKNGFLFVSFFITLLILLIFGLFKNSVYQVVFVVDGTEYKTMEIKKGSKIKERLVPERDGVVFIGWFDEEGNLLEKDTEIHKDTLYRARFGKIVTDEE